MKCLLVIPVEQNLDSKADPSLGWGVLYTQSTLTSLIWDLHPCSCHPLAWELHLRPYPGPYLAYTVYVLVLTCLALLLGWHQSCVGSTGFSDACWMKQDPIMGPTLPFLFRCSGTVPLFQGSCLKLPCCLASTSPSFQRCPFLLASWQEVFQALEIGIIHS